MNSISKAKFFVFFSIMFFIASYAFGANLVLDNPTVKKLEQATVKVTLEGNPTNIDGSGAAFTVIYDPEIVLDSVESKFFDTFQAQFQAAETPEPYSTAVDGYNQPLVLNNDTGKAMIAAARCTATDTTNTLFELKFSLGAGQPVGTYDVKIMPTTLNNTSAGYSADGETIPILVGSDPTKSYTSDDAYPVIIDDTVDGNGFSVHVTQGSATYVDDGCTNTENDLLCDEFEMKYFGDLTTSDGTQDFDNDGYTDDQEEEADPQTDPTDKDSYPGSSTCEPNNWNPIQGMQYNMTVFGIAYIGEEHAEGHVGAFGPGGDEDCRATGEIDANGNYYIVIAGNTNGEKIVFKLITKDDNECIILDFAESINFQADGNVSGFDLHIPLGITVEYNLVAGWNWVSFNVIPEISSVEELFGENSSKVKEIKNQTKSATNIGTMWIGTLNDIPAEIENGVMFKIKTEEAFTFTVTGLPVNANKEINLFKGWTWIGYLPQACMDTRDAINSAFGTLKEVKSQTQSKTKVNDSLFIGTLEEMCPGFGYAIHSSDAAVLQYTTAK